MSTKCVVVLLGNFRDPELSRAGTESKRAESESVLSLRGSEGGKEGHPTNYWAAAAAAAAASSAEIRPRRRETERVRFMSCSSPGTFSFPGLSPPPPLRLYISPSISPCAIRISSAARARSCDDDRDRRDARYGTARRGKAYCAYRARREETTLQIPLRTDCVKYILPVDLLPEAAGESLRLCADGGGALRRILVCFAYSLSFYSPLLAYAVGRSAGELKGYRAAISEMGTWHFLSAHSLSCQIFHA